MSDFEHVKLVVQTLILGNESLLVLQNVVADLLHVMLGVSELVHEQLVVVLAHAFYFHHHLPLDAVEAVLLCYE